MVKGDQPGIEMRLQGVGITDRLELTCTSYLFSELETVLDGFRKVD